jgi:chemotaxis protein MotD
LKKNEAAPLPTKDAAQTTDTKPAPQAAKDAAALNPQADGNAKAAEPAQKPERPVMPDAAAVRADSESKSLDGNGDAKPAAETRAAKQPETLENALARQFGGQPQSADPTPVTLPDATRAAQNNFTTASVTVQTSASAATNQPVPLQAAALAVEIASRAKDGIREFQIRLDPPELGRVDVKLNVDRHGQVNTHLTVDRPETLDLLRGDAQSLERALQQAGLKTSDGNLEFSLRQQTPDGFNQRQAQSQQGGDAAGSVPADTDTASSIHAEYQWAARLRGGVDIRV